MHKEWRNRLFPASAKVYWRTRSTLLSVRSYHSAAASMARSSSSSRLLCWRPPLSTTADGVIASSTGRRTRCGREEEATDDDGDDDGVGVCVSLPPLGASLLEAVVGVGVVVLLTGGDVVWFCGGSTVAVGVLFVVPFPGGRGGMVVEFVPLPPLSLLMRSADILPALPFTTVHSRSDDLSQHTPVPL